MTSSEKTHTTNDAGGSGATSHYRLSPVRGGRVTLDRAREQVHNGGQCVTRLRRRKLELEGEEVSLNDYLILCLCLCLYLCLYNPMLIL